MISTGDFDLLFLLLGGVAVYYFAERLGGPSRADKVATLARGLGLQYSGDEPPQLGLPDLPLFTYGTAENLPCNFIEAGEHAGARLWFFDFYYVSGAGKSEERGALTVALARLDSRRLPDFQLQPESLVDKLEQALGGDDVDLPDYPVFSRKYQLTSRAPELAKAFFYFNDRAKVLEARPGWYMQAGGDSLLLSRAGSGKNLVKIENYPAFIEDVKALLSELKL